MMEDETSSLDGKGLINMRVVDLKLELEKRGLSKSGSKKDLVKRLKQQLEFEKLCEERKSGDSHPKLELDAEIQQNEFVQQYLAQQQKRYAERQEEKRLELQAMKSPDEGSTISIEHQSEDDENMSSDTDDKDEEPQNLIKRPSEKESLSENTDDTNLTILKSVEADNKDLHTSECESKAEIIIEKNILPPQPITSLSDTDVKNNSENIELTKADENQNIIHNLSSITEIKDIKLSPSKCLSKTETDSFIVTENNKETDNHLCTANTAEKQKQFEPKIPNRSIDEEEDSNIAVETSSEELTTSGKCLDSSSLTSTKLVKPISCSVSPEKEVSDQSTNKMSSGNMEVSDCSPVPYSLSDIQLPESPSSPVKTKDAKCEEKNQTDHASDEVTNENFVSDNTSKSNGETAYKLNSSQEDVSESETKDSSYSNDSPEKTKKTQKRSDESSDAESDRSSSPYKKKSFKYEKTSSNLKADSDNDCPKDTSSKEQKHAKAQQNTDESENEKSSDSEKYSHHTDSKQKSHKRRKRDSRSSSSSSSRSSESSPERRRSKKTLVSKSKKNVQNEENNQMSDKSSDEKLVKQNKKDSITESTAANNDSVKKRLKIKRDNVSIEIPSSTKESLKTSVLDKSMKKKPSPHHTSNQPTKEESHKEKEKEPEVEYKPRKIILSSRKLNRKSTEENSIESNAKKCKWGSFSAIQKSSHTVNISSNSLKNWFPDFKLITETSMEVEQEEHSLSAIDEKTDDPVETDTLNENESIVKQESSSQVDVEDSTSQDANFDDVAEMGSVSKSIFIQNLVRPFTLNQLKELLKQSGKIVEEYFWIDKIKSKCFVMYETEKEAFKARNALNNTRWPSSNPKILSVEFSSLEELEKHKKGNEPQPIKLPEPAAIETLDTLETKVSHTVEEHKRKDRERRKEKDKAKFQAPVREWDKDKILQDSPEREHPPKEEKSKSAERKEKKESKKRAAEDTPAKLLDDLFQKTKSVPCIYWLPLTEEQAKTKEEEKKTRRLEREKRNQQLKEQEEAERRNRRARSTSRRREKENRKSSTRSRSPVSRRR